MPRALLARLLEAALLGSVLLPLIRPLEGNAVMAGVVLTRLLTRRQHGTHTRGPWRRGGHGRTLHNGCEHSWSWRLDGGAVVAVVLLAWLVLNHRRVEQHSFDSHRRRFDSLGEVEAQITHVDLGQRSAHARRDFVCARIYGSNLLDWCGLRAVVSNGGNVRRAAAAQASTVGPDEQTGSDGDGASRRCGQNQGRSWWLWHVVFGRRRSVRVAQGGREGEGICTEYWSIATRELPAPRATAGASRFDCKSSMYKKQVRSRCENDDTYNLREVRWLGRLFASPLARLLLRHDCAPSGRPRVQRSTSALRIIIATSSSIPSDHGGYFWLGGRIVTCSTPPS